MDKCSILKKDKLNDLITKLAAKKKVYAPVDKGSGNFAFAEVASGEAVAVNYIPTILPPKKLMMPQTETIQKFDKQAKKWEPVLEETPETVIFGVHTCDLAGIQCMDQVMGTDPKDVNYIAKRQQIVLIGLECNDYCDDYASCNVMGNNLPDGGCDVFLTDLGDRFVAVAGTKAGEKLIKDAGVFEKCGKDDCAALDAVRAKKKEIFKDEINIKRDDMKGVMAKTIESKVWSDVGGRCVSCGNCTNVCPTCYCFDVKDDINLDLNTGVRNRSWDSCQSEDFAKVAGGENFREERGKRQRHRYMRKFKFPVDRFGKHFCTGCGRCSRTCMAEINLKETMNALAGEAK